MKPVVAATKPQYKRKVKVKSDLIIALKEQRNGGKPVVYKYTLKLTLVTIKRHMWRKGFSRRKCSY